MSQLSVIAAAKVSHFEILCCVHGFVSTVGNFRRFYINSKNKGWMSFSKRSDTAQAEMVLFTFINHVDPTKVRIEEREVGEGEVLLLEFTKGCFVSLVGVMIKGVLTGEVPTTVVEKPKKMRKRKVVDGASGSALPPKRLREDHGTFGDAGASTAEKSLAALQVSSVARFLVPDPPIQTTTIATTVAAAPSISIPMGGTEPVRHSIFRDSVSPSIVEANIASPSQPADAELFVEFNVRVARQACFSTLVRLRSEHNYEERKKFERRCARMTGLLRKKDVEVANLKAQLSVKKAKAAEAIRPRSQDSMSCDELSIKAASLKSEKDKFVDQVSTLKTTCSGLCDQVLGYELFKEQIEAVQDKQVQVLSDRVVGLDFELIEMALHMDEEFYPRYLTTIAERRWILGRDLKLAVMKSLQSSEYLAALGGAIGLAIDKGMQDGLAAGIDHRKAERGLVDIAAYNPSVKANYVSAINALCVVDFLLLAQMESQKMQVWLTLWIFFVWKVLALRLRRLANCNPHPSNLCFPFTDWRTKWLLERIPYPFLWMRSRLISKASSFCTMSIFAVLMCAHKTCGISSIQSLLLSSTRAFIPSSKLLFDLSTKPLACGCLTEAKRWRIFVTISPAPEPSTQDDPSMNNDHGSGSFSSASMGVAGESSSRRSTMKSAKIYPFTDVLGMYCMSYSPSSILHFCSLPAISGFDNTCLIGCPRKFTSTFSTIRETRHPNLPESDEKGKNITDSQSPKEGVRRVLPEFRVTRPHPWLIASFSPDNNHPSPTLVSQIGNTSRTINIKPNKSPGLEKKPCLSSLPEQIFASLVNSPIILEALIEGFLVRMIYVNGGSSSEVMYEHCFQNLRAETGAKLKESKTPLVEFSSESRQTNKEGEPKDTIQPPPILSEENTQTDEKDDGNDESLEKSLESKPPEKVVIHNDYLDQTIIIGGNLSTECRSKLTEMLRKHADAFAWTLTDMTRIPCFVTEHELKTYPHIEPRVQRKRSIAPDRKKVVKDEVAKWFKSGIVRRNAGATYQRLVDTIFEGKIGRNLEAYVEDMVIKSKTELEMIKDVDEPLLTLKKAIKKVLQRPHNQSYHRQANKLNIKQSRSNEKIGQVGSIARSLWHQIRPKKRDKRQVLTDFLADTMAEDNSTQERASGPNDTLTEGENKEEKKASETKTLENLKVEADIWKVYTDRASNEHGSGISHIPREENRKADALSKLAVVQCEGLTKGVLTEELNERPMDTTKVNAIIEEATTTWMTPL
nr:reverse transcriptase domain-containing protein [Tanacetum cinerariifolium]